MSALLDSLAATFAGDASRRAVLDAALRDGLPAPRTESWKYTSLLALSRRSFAKVEATPRIDAAKLGDLPGPRIVFVNGRHDVALSICHNLPEGVSIQTLAETLHAGGDSARFLQRKFEGTPERSDEVFAKLNAALAGDGVLLRVAEGAQIEQPINLVFIGAEDAADKAWSLRNLIELRANSQLKVVEHHLGIGAHAHFANVLTHVHLAQGATLKHARAQDESDKATHFLRTDAVLARDAKYRRIDLELGAALARHELNVRLEGDGARLHANGVLFADARRHVETRLGIDHIGKDTSAELVWRGLGAGRGRAVFHGGILIREGADGTDAALSNKNLLLYDNAEIDSQPVLEIHADEVKAAHGATVGQLDASALFYLRSRGIPEAEAKRLLTIAFCREPLAVVGDGLLRELLQARLDKALQRLEA